MNRPFFLLDILCVFSGCHYGVLRPIILGEDSPRTVPAELFTGGSGSIFDIYV